MKTSLIRINKIIFMQEIKLKLFKKKGKKVSVNLPTPTEKNLLVKVDSGLIIYHEKCFYLYDDDILGYYKRDGKNSWYVFTLTQEQVAEIISSNRMNSWKCIFDSVIHFGYFYNHYFISDKKTETIKFSTPLDGNQLNYPDGMEPANMRDLNLSDFLLQTKSRDLNFNDANHSKAVWRDIQIDSILEDV
jgi:hypothetical protein